MKPWIPSRLCATPASRARAYWQSLNTYGSTIAREADAVLYTHAGPEVAVASTKAFLAQITACYLLGLYLAQLATATSGLKRWLDYLANLSACLSASSRFLDESEEQVRALGRELADNNSFLFLGVTWATR